MDDRTRHIRALADLAAVGADPDDARLFRAIAEQCITEGKSPMEACRELTERKAARQPLGFADCVELTKAWESNRRSPWAR